MVTVHDAIRARQLFPHFQPVVRLSDGAIHAHEALVRLKSDLPWTTPDQLFGQALAEGSLQALEVACVRLALTEWAAADRIGKLFLNMSATVLVSELAQHDFELLLTTLKRAGITPEGIVIELTEHERVNDPSALGMAVGRLRRSGIALALDDFGDGRSSLRLWSELQPEYVKIDKYFARDLHRHPERVQTLRALTEIARIFGSSLIAEGIESTVDLVLVRDLGIPFAQGWALGRPAAVPHCQAPTDALETIQSRDISVFPERRRSSQHRTTGWTLLREVQAESGATNARAVFDRFNRDQDLTAVPVVENGRPIGIIGRNDFLNRYARPFTDEIYGRHSCLEFANRVPRIVDIGASIDSLIDVLTSGDQNYLHEGVVITENGRYRGIGTAADLVRLVTESRIEAARHANPLTLLPGNIPISRHIARLLEAQRDFVACYADLNHFKPFNDVYGYWRGDEMILLAARCLAEGVDPARDFIGHVGGDDFIVLFQSEDWRARCLAIISRFNTQARTFFDESAQSVGGIECEDRQGVVRFHPLTTISIGAVPVSASGQPPHTEDIANAAAKAKHRAKIAAGNFYLLDALRAAASPQVLPAAHA